MYKLLFAVSLLLTVHACQVKKNIVDTIYINGKINTVNPDMYIAEAFAVDNGKIIAVGSNDEINKYRAKHTVDLNNQYVYPGFYDAHCHFLGYGLDLTKISLVGTKSFEEILDKLKANSHKRTGGWIFGRGWDQNDWEEKSYPTNEVLNNLFPDVPVYLLRIDGHAAIVNDYLLNLSGITAETKIDGGEVIVKDGKLTGVVIDNVLNEIIKHLPAYTIQEKTKALLDAQQNCFAVGLTTVADAGISAPEIELIQQLQEEDSLQMNVYAMVTYSLPNVNYYNNHGKIETDKLTVRSFKIYSDGALGSRGACLLEDYSDKKGHRGFLLNSEEYLRQAAVDADKLGFQLNTHAIGDSAGRTMLEIYSEYLPKGNDKRWRIEHAQVVNTNDFHNFSDHNIIPSVQPTHATSDMYWAEERLGAERMPGAYAYQTLLQENGMLANGSDFPVEHINPLYGFYAAVSRKDHDDYPPGGFNISEALTRDQALKAMTIWAAFSCFEEQKKGSIEPEKYADFVVLKEDLLNCELDSIPNINVVSTYIKGIKVH